MPTLAQRPGESDQSLKARRLARKDSHVENAHILLGENQITYRAIGDLLVLSPKDGSIIHFWPREGRFKHFTWDDADGSGNFDQRVHQKGHGIKNMIRYIKDKNLL